MSAEDTAGQTPAQGEPAGQLGVIGTWRQTPGTVRALLAGIFVSKLAGFLEIFLVLFLKNRGFSSGEAGIALGVYGAGAVLGTMVGGWLSDRLSARAATLISMAGTAVLLVSLLYVKVYGLLLVAVLLVAAISQLYRPAAQAMMAELTPPDRLVMVTAMYRLALNLGTTVAPLTGVALISVSYDLLFWAQAAAALAYALIALRLYPRTPKKADVAAAPEAAAAAGEPPRSGYREMLGDVRYLFFLLAFLTLCVVYCQYTAILPLAIKGAGLSLWWYGAVITINGALVVTCEVWVTKWVQTWPLRLVQTSGFALLAVGYGIYAIKMLPVFLVLGTLTWTASEITGAPTVYAYPGMVAPVHLRGRYYGAMQTMYSLGGTLGPIGGIFLFEHIGQRVFVVAALVAVGATVLGRIGMRGPAAPAAPGPTPEPEPATESAGSVDPTPEPEPAAGPAGSV